MFVVEYIQVSSNLLQYCSLRTVEEVHMNPYRIVVVILVVLGLILGFTWYAAIMRNQMESPNSIRLNWYHQDGTINWEAEKEQRSIRTDTIVVHHTASDSELSWEELSAIGKERQYVPRFNSNADDPNVQGKRVQSGHFRRVGKVDIEVFYTYHWLIRSDGKVERLLPDNEVGWHSGDWPTNLRSIGVCLEGDYSAKEPTLAATESLKDVIRIYEKQWGGVRLLGHSEVANTKCPGDWFRNTKGDYETLHEPFE